jgi:hypothetical protein
LPPDFFEQALVSGECCVCLDGLDELGAAGVRREITAAVSALANRYSRNRFIITSRIVGYEEAPLSREEFAHHTVQPLGDEDIKSFVEKWYRAREKDAVLRRERAEHLIKTIMDEERIKSLAANPLMLTIIALVHRIEAELPHERVKLYDKCVGTLVETWDKVRGIKTNLRRRLLEKLAYWMHSQPGEKGRTREVREGTLRLQLLHFLHSDPKLQLDDDQMQKEVADFIDLVKARSGLLVERGEGIYTFSHLTFQEYLASCDIVARCGHSTDAIWNEIQPKLHNTHWREVILLLLGSLNRFEHHNSILVRKIYESSDKYESFLHRYLLLAARILADRVEIEVELYNQIINDLLYFLKVDMIAQDDISQTIQDIEVNRRVIDRLINLTREENIVLRVSKAVAEILAEKGYEKEASEALLRIMGDKTVRIYERVNIFGEIMDFGRERKHGMDPFIVLGYDPDEEMIILVISSKSSMTSGGQLMKAQDVPGWIDRLGELSFAIRDDNDLGNNGDILNRFRHFITYDNFLLTIAAEEKLEIWTRSAAIRALGETPNLKEDILKGLFTLTRNEKTADQLRGEAIRALGKLGYVNEAIDLSLNLAHNSKTSAEARLIAANTLGDLHNIEKSLDILLKLAQDQSTPAHTRFEAASLLSNSGYSKESEGTLLAIARDSKASPYLRLRAIEALNDKSEKGINLVELARDKGIESWDGRRVINYLGELARSDEDILDELMALARDERVIPQVRSETASELANLGHVDQALELCLSWVQDGNLDVEARLIAARTLGQLHHTAEGIEISFSLLQDKNISIWNRNQAYDTLKSLLGDANSDF